MRVYLSFVYKNILGAIYFLNQIIQKKVGEKLSKLSKDQKTNTSFLKKNNHKAQNQNLLRPIQHSIAVKFSMIKLLKKINFIHYFLQIKKKFKLLRLKSIKLKLNIFQKKLFNNPLRNKLWKKNKAHFIKHSEKIELPSLQKRNIFKFTYLAGLAYLSFYFFIGGYHDYNSISKLLVEEINIENDNKTISNFSNEKIDKNNVLPYSITRFKSGLKKYSWILKKEKDIIVEGTQVALLMDKMIEDNYDLDKVLFTKEVPGFFINELPNDISYIKDTEVRKKIFISIVLPHIVETNRNIALKRNRLQKIYDKLQTSKTLTLSEHNWLINLAAEYSIQTVHVHKITIAKNLLKHIDIIPNSIAIAQAAKESGWGTSRFAKEGNALFGQWTYDNSNGLLPADRKKGLGHLIKSFDNLSESVVSYMNNINSHKAYDSFREMRSELRNNNQDLNSLILVHELSPYAELPNYTQVLELIIEKNELYNFDNIQLINMDSIV